jgi:hypothetical protein
VKDQPTLDFSYQRVEIPVAIEVGDLRAAVETDVDGGERTGGARRLDEGGSGGGSGIDEVAQLAAVVAERQVEVAIAVEIDQVRHRDPSGHRSEEIGAAGPLDEGRRRRRTGLGGAALLAVADFD